MSVDTRIERRNKVKVFIAPFNRGWVTMQLGPYNSNQGEYVNLTPNETAELGAWLLMMAGIAGSDTNTVSDMAALLREKFEDITRAVAVLSSVEAKRDTLDIPECPVCGRRIAHAGNRRRHIDAHGEMAETAETA